MRLDGNKVRRARERLGYSLELAGEKAEVSKNSVLRAEQGEDIRPSTARKIAEAFGVEVADLIDPEEWRPYRPPKPIQPEGEPTDEGLTRRFDVWTKYALGRLRKFERQTDEFMASRGEPKRLREWAETIAEASDSVMNTLEEQGLLYDLARTIDRIKWGEGVPEDVRKKAAEFENVVAALASIGPRANAVARGRTDYPEIPEVASERWRRAREQVEKERLQGPGESGTREA